MVFRYTDFTGERKQTQKRGFKTKREATAWEHEMMLRKGNKLEMTFESFYEIYSEYKRQRVKESTFETKSHIVRTKILPYFGKRKINEITVADVIAWQNEMMAYRDEKGKPYSVDYLKTIQAQLTAIFNHVVNYYNLPCNPARQAGCVDYEKIRKQDFGVIINNILDKDLLQSVLRIEPCGMKLSDWRNIAYHHTYALRDDGNIPL